MIALAKKSIPPMEARVVDQIPRGNEWQYEPKWDGFRCIAFRDNDKVELQSKAEKSLTRYFPEVVEMLRELPPRKFVLDGELVVPIDGELSFDALLQRIHPAESRIRKLSQQTPASYIVFDLLRDERDKSLRDELLADRRRKLESFAKKYFSKKGRIVLSPATRDFKKAQAWFASAGRGRDGIVAKRIDMPYTSGERTGMVKIKKRRSADCVVGGFRYASKGKIIGSLLLGLYDDDGLLNHVGFTSSLSQAQRTEITPKLEKIRKPQGKGGGFTGNAPGGPSRWSTERSSTWEAVAPKLVVEVEFDHFTGGRFRHGTKFVRWRPDKSPRQCTMEQVKSSTSRGALRF